MKQHDCKREFDDRQNKKIKEEEWKLVPSDWSIMVDADEFIYFPAGVNETLFAFQAQRIPVPKPHGYEMLSDEYPTVRGQIYDEVKMGSREELWYNKPVIFASSLIASVEFSTGAHTMRARLKTGRTLDVPQRASPTNPPVYLLHFHHIGGLDRIARLYDENRARQSAVNKANKWGLQEPGAIHAKRKRDLILPNLERVIP